MSIFLRDFAKSDKLFITACKLADTPPTRRQASKWAQCRGKAFAVREAAREAVAKEGRPLNAAN